MWPPKQDYDNAKQWWLWVLERPKPRSASRRTHLGFLIKNASRLLNLNGRHCQTPLILPRSPWHASRCSQAVPNRGRPRTLRHQDTEDTPQIQIHPPPDTVRTTVQTRFLTPRLGYGDPPEEYLQYWNQPFLPWRFLNLGLLSAQAHKSIPSRITPVIGFAGRRGWRTIADEAVDSAGLGSYSGTDFTQLKGLQRIYARLITPDGICDTRIEKAVTVCGSQFLEDFTVQPADWVTHGDAYWDPSGWIEMTGIAQGKKVAVIIRKTRFHQGRHPFASP